MIGIVIAMQSEADILLEEMHITRSLTISGKNVHVGIAYGKDIVLCVCGVGKVNAAVGTQILISEFRAEKILNFGVAGGLNDTTKLCAVYQISDATQFDFDLVQLNGTKIGTLNEYEESYLPLSAFKNLEKRKLGTADRFNDSHEDYLLLTQELEADIRDMEGGAIVQAAYAAGLPVYSVKAISDVAGSGSTTEQYLTNKDKALKNFKICRGGHMIDLGDWNERLTPLFADERYLKIRKFLIEEYKNHTVYPDMYDLYNCFRYTQFSNLKVVLLGQDPYHNVGQAHGLCFSVQDGIPKPPSLENIFKELKADIGCELPQNGNLTKWAKEGVLLMNTSLSVRAHQANSHSKCGWAWFTDSVIKLISEQKKHVVFILWGGNARSKKPLIDQSKHLILETVHPSPLSAYNGFFGCKHFSKTNEYLIEQGLSPIDWDLTK